MYDLNSSMQPGPPPSNQFLNSRNAEIRRVCSGFQLFIPEGYELIPDGESVQDGDYMISKERNAKDSYPYKCCESVGRIVFQSASSVDPDSQGGYFYIRKTKPRPPAQRPQSRSFNQERK